MSTWRHEEPLPDGSVRVTFRDPRTTENELLWAERFPPPAVGKLKMDLGQYADAQLQQNPVAKEGGVFKHEWIRYWSPGGALPGTVALPAIGSDLASWDCAFKGSESSDPSCGGVWRRAGGRFYLLDAEWGRWDFPQLVEAVQRLIRRHPRVIHKIVEAKANGPAIVATLQEKYPGFEEVEPEGGKEARAHSVAPLFKAGLVLLPHPSMFPWVTDAVTELTRFPRGAHDDFVDMSTQALLKLHIAGPKLAEAMAAIVSDPSLRKLLGR